MIINTSLAYAYTKDLIPLLKAEHQELANDCDLIFRFIKDENFIELNKVFNRFSTLIRQHLANERRMYMYLELVVSKSDGTYKEIRSTMRAIGTSANATTNLYTNVPIDNNNLNTFKRDFAILTKSLLYRMQYEEEYLFLEYEANHSS